ncbi:hypothetical protein AGMMS49525_08100 [Bacteroidia bacterium]|nr:hypothetical protein AGMMS49525_08100 [Bacteroidia bacterium]
MPVAETVLVPESQTSTMGAKEQGEPTLRQTSATTRVLPKLRDAPCCPEAKAQCDIQEERAKELNGYIQESLSGLYDDIEQAIQCNNAEGGVTFQNQINTLIDMGGEGHGLFTLAETIIMNAMNALLLCQWQVACSLLDSLEPPESPSWRLHDLGAEAHRIRNTICVGADELGY